MSGVRPALQTALKEHGGLLPFDRFMEIALHHPDGGYYAKRIRGIGHAGDFTTMPKLTRSLAQSLAQWLRQEGRQSGWKDIPIIECGPGDGSLAAGILREFGWLERRRYHWHLVETSTPLRSEQERALGRFRARWHTSVGEALAACGGRALIYHNEFFDAFPCRVFKRVENAWNELHLKVVESRLASCWLPPQRPLPESTAFQHPWPAGQQVEVFESVHTWMQGMAGAWQEGTMLVIDYGGDAQSVYHRRPNGTLRAYRRHERLEGEAVFEMPGLQDVTADVSFSDLAQWARPLGWTVGFEQSLAEFSGMQSLPEAAAAFRCLELRCGLTSGDLASGARITAARRRPPRPWQRT